MIPVNEKDLIVRALVCADARDLAVMLSSENPEYARFFTPFSFDEPTVSEMLAASEEDVWMGLYWQAQLAGFFMLRGWDHGYDVPAYGVFIAEAYRGRGFATLSLRMAKALCKLLGAPRIMLKVHPDNLSARKLFERAGFLHTGFDSTNENLIYHFDVNR